MAFSMRMEELVPHLVEGRFAPVLPVNFQIPSFQFPCPIKLSTRVVADRF